jgi:hypothetical protein
VNGQDFEQWWKCVSKYTNFRKYGPEIKDTVKALFGVSEIITELDPRQIYFDSKVVKFVKFNQEYNLWMYEKESLQTLRNMIEEKIKELIGSLNPLYIEEAVRNITNDLSFTVEISGQGERKFQLPEDFRSALQTYIK